MNKYWFCLNPQTFLWITNDKVLLYDSLHHRSLIFRCNNEINSILKQFHNIENLYCIEITDKEMNRISLRNIITKIVKSGFGNIRQVEEGRNKPAFFVPVLKLQNRMEKIDHFVIENENMLQFLHEVSIYLNEQQTTFNQRQNKSKLINVPFPELLRFLTSFVNSSSLSTINFYGRNLLEYSSIDSLMGELSNTSIKRIFNVKSNYLAMYMQKLLSLKTPPDQINITIENQSQPDKIRKIIDTISPLNIQIVWIFKITSESDYNVAEDIINTYHIQHFEIYPFFNGTNHDFFKEFVYLTEEDIQNSQLSKREIFSHQVLNTNNFGKLFIKANGMVYANLYQNPLGTINDPINELLCTELSSNSSWLRIRNKKPCCDCIYQWLCPSPSDYEQELGQYNLCQVIK